MMTNTREKNVAIASLVLYSSPPFIDFPKIIGTASCTAGQDQPMTSFRGWCVISGEVFQVQVPDMLRDESGQKKGLAANQLTTISNNKPW